MRYIYKKKNCEYGNIELKAFGDLYYNKLKKKVFFILTQKFKYISDSESCCY